MRIKRFLGVIAQTAFLCLTAHADTDAPIPLPGKPDAVAPETKEADAIVGEWVTQKGEARFHIFKKKGKYHGKIVWLKEPKYPPGDPEAGKPVRDRNNPDKSKRNQPIIGLQLLNDLTYAGRNTWTDGTIYNADDGRTYRVKAALKSPKKLYIRGYVGISLLGGTTLWTRYEKPKPAKDQRPPKPGERQPEEIGPDLPSPDESGNIDMGYPKELTAGWPLHARNE